ncbi:unnamed protein product [Closterium sp. Yama58-4]|nr:unnamed protein product [Closterium sp. Yama58-4]
MSENVPLTSTTSETEGSYAPPLLFQHAQPAEPAENVSAHAEQWESDDGDVKVTVTEHLVSHAVDFPSLKAEPQEEQAEAHKAAARFPQKSFDHPTAGGWNDFDKSSAIFNFSDRPVRDAGWRFVFAAPLVFLLVAALRALVYAPFDPSSFILISPSLYPVALILLFAVSLPLPMLIVSSLRKIPARVLSALIVLAAVICALQSATSAVHYYTTPALVPPNAADVAPVEYAPVRDPSASDFSVNTDFAESADGESGKTNEQMAEEEEAMVEAAIEASERGTEGGTEGGMEGGTEGGMEGGTEGAMGDYMEGQEVPSEAAVSIADDAAAEMAAAAAVAETESSSSAPTSSSSAPSGSSSPTATSDLGRGLFELALPAIAHPVVTVTAQHAAHLTRAVHSAARRHLQSHASDAGKRARGRSLQGENRLDVAMVSAILIARPLYFIAFVVLGLFSVVAMLLVLSCNHHLPLAASAVAHAAQTAIAQAPVIFFMPLPVILAVSFLCLPLMNSLPGDTSLILFVLLLPTSFFVAQVLSALLIYSTAAVFARLYVTTSGSSSRSSSEGGKVGEGEEGVTLRGQLELFSSAFSLACTSSLGTCCAIAITSCATTILQVLLSAIFLALFGESILGCLLLALLHCTQIVIRFFLNCLVLPTSAMSGHGFTRSLRLSLDILQRFLAPIVTANAAGLALLTMLVVPIVIIYNIIGLIGVYAYEALFPLGDSPMQLGALALLLEALLIVFVVCLLSVVALSSVLTTGVATTVLCFAWDKKLEPEEGSDAAGLVGDESISSADVKDTSPV